MFLIHNGYLQKYGRHGKPTDSEIASILNLSITRTSIPKTASVVDKNLTGNITCPGSCPKEWMEVSTLAHIQPSIL